MLTNATYTLIHEKYWPVFNSLNGQVSNTPVKIRDDVIKTETHHYAELKVFNFINPETIRTFDSSGPKVWTFNGELFVSGEVKKKLLQTDGQGIAFNLGFSVFAG